MVQTDDFETVITSENNAKASLEVIPIVGYSNFTHLPNYNEGIQKKNINTTILSNYIASSVNGTILFNDLII